MASSGLDLVQGAKFGVWAVAAKLLFAPSFLRVAEILALQTDAVVTSDLILAALGLFSCPLGFVARAIRGQDAATAKAIAVAAAAIGAASASHRHRRLQSTQNQSVELELSEKGPVWRSSLCPNDELTTRVFDNVPTLYHNFFSYAAEIFAEEKCLGRRAGGAGPYDWENYAATAAAATAFGSGLRELGVEPGTTLGIYSVNSPQWILAELGAYAYKIIVVALYSTLGQDAVEYVVQHSEMTTALCSVQTLGSLLAAAPKCDKLQTVIFIDEGGSEPTSSHTEAATAAGIKLISFSEVKSMGEGSKHPHIKPSADDIATIMYTSGTTGNPKGVILTHSNLVATMSTYPVAVEGLGVNLTPGDRYISYLPLAHIFERAVLHVMLMRGVAVGFYSGKIEALVDDIAELKPTFLAGVPRVFNRVHEKVLQKVQEGGKVKRFLFQTALDEAIHVLKAGGLVSGELPLWNLLVFKKIRSRLGGNCRVILSGGAPLGLPTQQFLRAAFGCPCIQGYGLTETAAAGSLGRLDDPTSGHVGPPVPCLELKLAPVEEMGYLTTDQPNPRGEICLRGGSIMKGYFKEEQMTKEVIDGEGWFHTGDIGLINDRGTLSIIDRKKNIFKLSQGEYVAAEKLETIYASARLVSQIFVYGDSLKSDLVAVVVPDLEAVRLSMGETTKDATDEELCTKEEVKNAILKDIQDKAKESNMKGFEVVRAIAVEAAAFSVENNLMTPTFKLKRPQLQTKYKSLIEQLYQELRK